MARRYKVEGTKSFMYWAIGLLLLGLWCVKDGWFPGQSVIEAHPPGEDVAYYLFNQITAVICLIGAAVCGYIHLLVK
jgi:hypothetical protein